MREKKWKMRVADKDNTWHKYNFEYNVQFPTDS